MGPFFWLRSQAVLLRYDGGMIQSKILQMLCKAVTVNDLLSAAALLQSNPGMLESNWKLNVENESVEQGTSRPYVEFEQGDSPLMRAIDNGNAEMVKLLLDNGADPDEHHGYNYGLPAQAAMWKGHLDIVHLLLDYGADPGRSTAMADMELTGYSLFCGDEKLVNRIYAAGGRADIFAYIKANRLAVLGELLDHCPDVPANNPNVKGSRTVVQAIRGEAAWCGNADALAMALATEAINSDQAKHHMTAAIASHNRLYPVEDYLRCFSLLFDSVEENFDKQDFYPLHQLARKNNIEGRVAFARFFVERGIDPDLVHPESKQQAIDEAVENRHKDLVAYLQSIG